MLNYYAQWIREGKLPVDSDWNRELKVKFTLQDPSQYVRKTFGEAGAENLRYVTKKVVGEENFIDMTPSGMHNFCCGGGGGALQSGRPNERRQYGRTKFDQIMKTGAGYVITPCHNCHSQIHDLGKHFKGGFHSLHLWTLICLSLGILGENERKYLGPDLAEVGL